MLQNELTLRNNDQINEQLDAIWNTMNNAINIGIKSKGTIPGPLHLQREAADLFEKIEKEPKNIMSFMDYLQVYAIATSEQNAVGGRIVTAPTNGAAGVIPAVLKYLKEFYKD